MKKRTILHDSLIATTFTAVSSAISIVLCRFFAFPPASVDSIVRVDFGFLPISVIAELFGPLYSGAGYLVADIIGSFASGYPPNPYIALCKLLSGIILGIFFCRGRTSFPKVVIAFSVIAVLIDFICMSPIFVFIYDWTWGAACAARALNALVNLPLRIVSFYFLSKALKTPLRRFRGHNK